MGIQRVGPFSGFVNKVGNLVGSTWRTLDVIRARPKLSNKPPTQAQLDQRAKFKLVTTILAPLVSLINDGFKADSGISTPMNVAVALNYGKAITGSSPNFSFDYEKLQFSKGNLAKPQTPEVSTIAGYKMKFSWISEFDDELESPLDQINFLMYCPDLNKWAKLQGAVKRSAKTYTFQMPASFGGHEIMCYVSAVSATSEKASDSVYIATLVSI